MNDWNLLLTHFENPENRYNCLLFMRGLLIKYLRDKNWTIADVFCRYCTEIHIDGHIVEFESFGPKVRFSFKHLLPELKHPIELKGPKDGRYDDWKDHLYWYMKKISYVYSAKIAQINYLTQIINEIRHKN